MHASQKLKGPSPRYLSVRLSIQARPRPHHEKKGEGTPTPSYDMKSDLRLAVKHKIVAPQAAWKVLAQCLSSDAGCLWSRHSPQRCFFWSVFSRCRAPGSGSRSLSPP